MSPCEVPESFNPLPMNVRLSLATCLALAGGLCTLPVPTALAQTTPTTEASASRAAADPSHPLVGQPVQVMLNDGTLKFGVLLDVTADEVRLETAGLGVVTIPKHMVLRMVEGRAKISGQPSRYFFAPSGHQLAKNEGYFQSNIALNSVSYGFSDHLTMGAVMSFLGAGATAKLGAALDDKVHVSTGGLVVKDYYGWSDQPVALGFLNFTVGDEDRHWTLNLGVGNNQEGRPRYPLDSPQVEGQDTEYLYDDVYAPTQVAYEQTRPWMVNFSAMTPLTESRWLLTENYLIVPVSTMGELQPYSGNYQYYLDANDFYTGPSSTREPSVGILSLGIRNFNQRSGWLWDYGLVGIFTGTGDGFAVPWFSFTLEF